MLTTLQAVTSFESDKIEAACRDLAEKVAEGKLGKVMMPLRAALTGTNKSPSLFHAAEILGKDETISRIKAASEYVEKGS